MRPRYGSSNGSLPPPLPPETRTVGQLVAETLKLYGRRFWRSLAVGVGLAVDDQIFTGSQRGGQMLAALAGAFLLTASYVGASALVAEVRPARKVLATAFAGGVLAYLPFTVLVLGFVLPGVGWLALVGLVVPVAVIEQLPLRAAFARAIELARADYVHALGSLATLVVLFFLVRLVLFFLLRGAGDATDRGAVFLADLVISPVVFLGAALLYFDQAARVDQSSPSASHSRR